MKRYIGLDVHATSTTFAVLSESGKRLGAYVVETNGQALVERLKTIPGDKYVALEEGTQSAWMYEILSPHAKEVVVAAIAESRGQKDDERDAYKLAEDLRTGAIKRRVFKDGGQYTTLRELSRTHAMVVQDVVRIKNRIKSLFRHPTDEPLHQHYQRLLAAGTKPNLAKLTLARKIAAIALSMWKSKEGYDPTKRRKPS